MINTKHDLKFCLQEDLKRYHHKPNLRDFFWHTEDWYTWKLNKLLRYTEFYLNNKDKNILYKLLYKYYLFKFNKIKIKTGISIFPNTLGCGYKIHHIGKIMIGGSAKIGKNFSIRPLCTIGYIGDDYTKIAEIGDDVDMSVGASIYGYARIGRGAKIGPNSIVMNNVPPYSIVLGIPAKVVGFRYTPEEIIEIEKTIYPEEDRIPLKILERNYDKYYINRRNVIASILSTK